MLLETKNDPLWNDHALFVGVNYHPHDWPADRWAQDVRFMKEAGFSLVRLGHLAWDSYEPQDGVYAFQWFDRVMDLFADAGIKVILDIAASPAPVWLFRKHPDISPRDGHGRPFASHRRYGEDIGHPD